MTKILYIPSGQYLTFAARYDNGYYTDTPIYEEALVVSSLKSVEAFLEEFLYPYNWAGIKYRAEVPQHAFLNREEFEVIYD